MNVASPAPYPMVLSPLLFQKVWGGDRLARLGKAVNIGGKVGESWEVADLAVTSASGAGGGAAVSVVANGALKGKTLHDAIKLWGEELLGAHASAEARGPKGENRFPLLVKFIDARENLSVQVHPSPAYLRAHPEERAHLKTECWYVLAALKGSMIYKGVKPGVTRGVFEKHLQTGDGSALVADLEAVPAIPGQMHNIPSGTVHALGGGVLIAEVQTPSDTTFRVYDWGRSGRDLHIDQALECIQFGPARAATWLAPGDRRARLVSTGYFTVDELALHPGEPAELVDRLADAGVRRCRVVMVISGECEILVESGGVEPVAAALGTAVVVPAGIAEACRVQTGNAKGARVLVVTAMG